MAVRAGEQCGRGCARLQQQRNDEGCLPPVNEDNSKRVCRALSSHVSGMCPRGSACWFVSATSAVDNGGRNVARPPRKGGRTVSRPHRSEKTKQRRQEFCGNGVTRVRESAVGECPHSRPRRRPLWRIQSVLRSGWICCPGGEEAPRCCGAHTLRGCGARFPIPLDRI
jgi:hypothetical protein